MNNSFTLGMGDDLDTIFNDLFSTQKTASRSAHEVHTTREQRNKAEVMRLRVRSPSGGVNLVTVDKQTPIYNPNQTRAFTSQRHSGDLTYIVDYGTHRTLNVLRNGQNTPFVRDIVV
ncbi:hypothetical protein [Xenorhabdus bovienii]|uniref:Uncharacterized protein n=1 Tax=Xenorhabdus bovienii str. puntauvense TaxID=1398201 RepID=A0A077NBI7_XENBV|nr:hypothetical protein [Xenorhabdus bovienii]CDG87199.1 conserved hypothetical protein [Xenorhabdus bovienii str. feltiae France]CDG91488.1 conserved hypothetical protein [Xenorhabdus bovienii str. feltiae Florida]CDG95597.1 conserved hypothetical protein [Xenorhabdus bovienii str. puntauvense]